MVSLDSKKLFLFLIIVVLTKHSQSSLSFKDNLSKTVLKLCQYPNNSCIDEFLSQRFVIFNSKNNQNVTVNLGAIKQSFWWSKNNTFSSTIHVDRRAFLLPSKSNEVTINAICQFSYAQESIPYIENDLCCRIDLELDSPTISNPYSFCDFNIIPQPVYCYFPIKFTPDSFLQDKIFPLVGRIYRKKSNTCDYKPSQNMIYSVSSPLTVSFSTDSPVIWRPNVRSETLPWIVVGVPLHSVKDGENLLIPVRLISDRTDLNNQIVNIQCNFNANLNFQQAIPNFPNVSEMENFTFTINSKSFLNIKLKITPGLDQQLMFLNVTVMLNSGGSVKTTELNCCINPKIGVKSRKNVCDSENSVQISVQEPKAIMIIPIINYPSDIFAIYSKPNIELTPDQIQVLGITNDKDRTTTDLTTGVKMYPVDSTHLTTSQRYDSKVSKIDMQYQTFLNPWSLQLNSYGLIHTLISPVRVWLPESWTLVLSDSILLPIQNWSIPQSAGEICVPRYKVAKLKILCRLYLIEETGEKRYIGKAGDNGNQIPYVDVTSLTNLTQLKVNSKDIISIHKSEDQNYFLIYAQQVDKFTDINLVSMDSSAILATTRVSVGRKQIHVVDLIVHCVDAILLAHQNKTLDSFKTPDDHKSITVSLTSDRPSQPCYLLIFVVFSDQSVERISTVSINEYRLLVTQVNSDETIIVKDSQLVSVKQVPRVNISLYEPKSCNGSRLIFTKKIEWSTVQSIENIIPIITSSYSTTIESNIIKNKTVSQLINDLPFTSVNLVHIAIYICTGLVGISFISFILVKLICSRNVDGEPRNNGSPLDNYQISGSLFLDSSNTKIPIRTSNSKNFSALGKCSANCLRQNPNKTHTNEPYPPLLPPPGPIAANYDLTISDPVCNDSAVDSGVEVGKLSSYSSNTCPSNDLCYTIDHYQPCTAAEEPLGHPQYPAAHFSNPMTGFYHQKGFQETDNQFHDSVMLTSLNSTKTISNLRHPSYW